MKDKFDNLTMAQQGELMKLFIKHGYRNLDEIKNIYNTYANGGLLDKPLSYEKPLPQVRYADGGPTKTNDKKKPTKFQRALYNSINPTGDYPINMRSAAQYFMHAKRKQLEGKEDIREWEIGESLGEKVADAAWRKRMDLPYDSTYLPTWNGDTLRLPYELEMEIPVDTNFLKNRIDKNKTLLNRYKSTTDIYRTINAGIIEDENTLNALRRTYKTGEPVGVNELSANSRRLIDAGYVNNDYISPLNVLKNYNIRYDAPTNRMYYSDEYDFNEFEKYVPGEPFRFRGYIDLNKKAYGGPTKKKPFDKWYLTVPEDRNDTTDYNLRRAYEMLPIWQLEQWRKATPLELERGWKHLPSVYKNPDIDEYEFLKSKYHPSSQDELNWYNSDMPDAVKFRRKYDLDTTGEYYKYVPRYITQNWFKQ